MKRETFPFTTKEDWLKLRLEDITSTEVPALFGISPYMTEFELWHNKKNKALGEFEENERMKWGTRLQESIAGGIAEDECWKVVPFKEYMRIPSLRIGSSFDYVAITPEDCLLEIKNVDAIAFKEGWLVDGDNVEAPPHIELQVQHELYVSGYEVAYIGALIGGNRVVLIKRMADKAIHAEINKKVSNFWASIENGKEPKPDFNRDAEFIAKLMNKATGEEVVANDEVTSWALAHSRLGPQIKDLEQHRAELKAKILLAVGTASKVTGENFSISLGETKGSTYTVVRKPGRNFRIYVKGDEIND